MAEYIVQDTTLIEIADAVRAKKGTTEPIALTDFAAEIESIETSQVESNEISVGNELGAIYFNTGVTPDFSNIQIDDGSRSCMLISFNVAGLDGYGVELVDLSKIGTIGTYSGYALCVQCWQQYENGGIGGDSIYVYSTSAAFDGEIAEGWQNLSPNGGIVFPEGYKHTVTNVNFQEEWSSYIGKNMFAEASRMSLAVGEFANEVPFSVKKNELAGITGLRQYAFYGSSINSIELPDGLITIGSYALANCTNIKEIEIPNSVSSINGNAFRSCSSLNKITLYNEPIEIYSGAFAYGKITTVNYNGSISDWNNNIKFNDTQQFMSSAETVIMDGEILDLNDLHIGDGIEQINYYVFSGWKNLTKVTIDEGVVRLRQNAFYNDANLTYITIPSSVTVIEWRSLYCGSSSNKCTYVFKGTTPPQQTSSGSLALSTSYIDKIIVPAGCGEVYKTAENWTRFADYIEEAAE